MTERRGTYDPALGDTPRCQDCDQQPAVICDECRRALATKSWNAVNRQPQTGQDCRLCESGPASWCPSCWLTAVNQHRQQLRDEGHAITPPGEWATAPLV